MLLTLVGVFAVVFYDTTIPLINGIIHLKINVLGFFLEPLLQLAFDVSIRQAQIISAWIYLLIAVFLFGFLLIKTFQSLLVFIYTARRSWLALTKWQKVVFFLFFTILFMIIGKMVLLVI